MQLSLFLVKKSVAALTAPASHVARITVPDLRPFLPENSPAYILNWFQSNPVQLRISKARTSKFGDYRAPLKNSPARISINRNLNRYDFLITLVHEMAHHEVWLESVAPVPVFGFHKRKRRLRPHGKEWKNHYRTLMAPLMKESVFPAEVLQALENQFEHPRSSAKANENLVLALREYDPPDNSVFVESLPFDALFALPSGRQFRKREKLRKRYQCRCLGNGKIYLFSPVARVLPVKP
jgi:SprT protein